MKENLLEKHYCVVFNAKSGKIDLTLDALGTAQLDLYVIQNLKSGQEAIVFSAQDGSIHSYGIGKKNSMPELLKGLELPADNIDECCEGLLEALNEEN